MSTTSGVHAGFFWKVEEGAIYFVNEEGTCSPFQNPQFAETFKKSNHIAFDFFIEDTNKKFEHPLLEDLSKTTELYLSDEEVTLYNQKLEKQIEDLPPHPLLKDIDLKKRTQPREEFVRLLFIILLSALAPSKELEKFSWHALKTKAQESNKECISLFSREEHEKYLVDLYTSMLKIPSFYTFFKKIILSPEEMKKWKTASLQKGIAWDFGAHSAHNQHTSFSPETEKMLESTFQQELSHPKIQEIDTLSRKYFLMLMTMHSIKLAEKVSDLLKKHPKAFVIAPVGFEETLFSVLSERTMRVQGPLRESIKPCGFLWEIKKANVVVGHFLASVHITPQWILDFNSKTLAAFHSCDVLGVEVDITREGVNFSRKFEIPDEKTREKLLNIVKVGFQRLNLSLNEENVDTFIEKGIELIESTLQKKHGIESGIDLFFIGEAKKNQKPVIDLETIELHQEFLELVRKKGAQSQSELFEKPAEELYEELEKAITREIIQLYPEMLELGYCPTLEMKFDKLPLEEQQAINRRNMQMAISTDNFIRNGKKPLSIAGALHFAGPMGMQKLMKNMGYTVTQIICEEPRK